MNGPRRGTAATGALLLAAAVLAPAGCCRHAGPQQLPQPQGVSDLKILPPEIEVNRAQDYDPRERSPEAAPTTLSQELPRYPAAALADAVHCVARLLYHIQIDGSARLVRLRWDEAPPAAHLAAFEAAIREAVASWRFEPAKRYDFRERDDGTVAFSEKPIPKARNAVITFRVVDGQPVVR